MIEAKETLTGNITSKQTISGEMNVTTEFISPPLIDLEVVPSREQQVFTHENSYGYDKVTVEPYTPNVNTKTITANGTYNASDDNLDGYSSVEVATSGVDINDYFGNTVDRYNSSTQAYISSLLKKIPENITIVPTSCAYMFMGAINLEEIPMFDTSKITSMTYMFQNCRSLKTIPELNTSNVTNMSYMFDNCESLETIPQLNMSNVTTISTMFRGCKNLKTISIPYAPKLTGVGYTFANCTSLESISALDTSNATQFYATFRNCTNLTTLPLLDCGKISSLDYGFDGCPNLTNLGGFKDLGKAYTLKSNNYSAYQLNLTSQKLTHESLMNVINNLYDLNITYDVANGGTLYRQRLSITAFNKAKLTEEEIAIATNKGWNVI